MDRFTRNYSLGLGIIVVGLLALWVHASWAPRVWEINRILESDPLILDYPYQFRLVSLKEGVATISTPRSAAFPAIQFIPVIYPELAGKDQADPAMVKAQQALVDRQKHVMDLVGSLPDVHAIAWALDVRWLADHGVQAPTSP